MYEAWLQTWTVCSNNYSCGTHFFSLLMDGTTDCGNQEDELMVLYSILF